MKRWNGALIIGEASSNLHPGNTSNSKCLVDLCGCGEMWWFVGWFPRWKSMGTNVKSIGFLNEAIYGLQKIGCEFGCEFSNIQQTWGNQQQDGDLMKYKTWWYGDMVQSDALKYCLFMVMAIQEIEWRFQLPPKSAPNGHCWVFLSRN